MANKPYIFQTGGMACSLFAMCNAARYLGYDTPEPGTPAWVRLALRVDPRSGASGRLFDVASHLGLHLEWCGIHEAIEDPPAFMIVPNPVSPPLGETLGFTHAVCLVGGDKELAHVVNYRQGHAPCVEHVPWPALVFTDPCMPSFLCWKVKIYSPKTLFSWSRPLLERVVKHAKMIVR